uniref:Uncharacterized protein n=1 Tax=Moniliophthora roreri TaxID=221103 RepID=A0A0W0F3W2_MONRR
MCGNEEEGYVSPSLEEWVDLLSEMLKLRKLDIAYPLPSVDSRPHGIITPFFPHLQALILSVTVLQYVNLLEHLSFPNSTCNAMMNHGFKAQEEDENDFDFEGNYN